MKDGFVRILIFLVIFTAAFSSIARVDTERLYFDEAKINARSFVRTMCRMGEITRTSYNVFLNSLPHGYGPFDISITARDGRIDNEKLSDGECIEFDIGDEIALELIYKDRIFKCRGRVNGLRR